MSRKAVSVLAAAGAVVTNVSLALANEPTGGAPDYSGVTGLYYTFIVAVLAYGVYDTFVKKS